MNSYANQAARFLFAGVLWVGSPWAVGQPTFTDVTFGDGKFVGVGFGLSIQVSTDGTNWTRRSDGIKNVTYSLNYRQETYSGGGAQITLAFPEVPPIQPHGAPSILTELKSVAYGGGTFVAVGQHGAIVTSRDTENWHLQIIGQPNDFRCAAWGGSSFVVAGADGELLSSPDGVRWTRRKTGIKNSLNAVTYGNARFVAVGSGPVLTSPDAVTWTAHEGPEYIMHAVTFGRGKFLAADETGAAFMSVDGDDWQPVTHALSGQRISMRPTGMQGGLNRLSFAGDSFFASTSDGIFISRDGKSWSPVTFFKGFRLNYEGVAYGNNMFVAGGDGYGHVGNTLTAVSSTSLAASADGRDWVPVNTPPARMILGYVTDQKRITMIPRQLVALDSTNGVDWVTSTGKPIEGNVGGCYVFCVNPDNKQDIAVLVSDDGIRWKRLNASRNARPPETVAASNPPTTSDANAGISVKLNGRIYHLNLAAKVGQTYELQASTDLERWVILTVFTQPGQELRFDDPEAASIPHRFYRLRLLP